MSTWTADELHRIGSADELDIATTRGDGSLRPWVTIWVVRVGDDLYVRSYRGPGGSWNHHALRHPEGRIRAADVERDVTFDQAVDESVHDAVDQAYHAKYARYGDTYLEPMLSADATATTLKLAAR